MINEISLYDVCFTFTHFTCRRQRLFLHQTKVDSTKQNEGDSGEIGALGLEASSP